MNRRLAITVLAVTIAACACGGADDASQPDSAIRGTVTAGPQCPVEIAGSPCPDAPWTGTVRISGTEGETVEVETSDAGRFRVALDPGTYEVVAVLAQGVALAEPQTVTVVEGIDAEVRLTVDTGIR